MCARLGVANAIAVLIVVIFDIGHSCTRRINKTDPIDQIDQTDQIDHTDQRDHGLDHLVPSLPS